MVMRFRTWLEDGTSLNAGFPELGAGINRGAATTASDEVLRTGLQPQVDSKEIHTDQKDDLDKIQAVDAAIKRADIEMPQGIQDNEILNRFRKLWKSLKEKWEDLKIKKDDDSGEIDTNGLGSTKGDENLIKKMQMNPNALMTGSNQVPTGPSLDAGH